MYDIVLVLDRGNGGQVPHMGVIAEMLQREFGCLEQAAVAGVGQLCRDLELPIGGSWTREVAESKVMEIQAQLKRMVPGQQCMIKCLYQKKTLTTEKTLCSRSKPSSGLTTN